ncbi:MAG: hypothetical protein AAF696_35540 [Bacteroidota bacterium]
MKNLKIYLLAILVLLSATSCQDVYFGNPQPKGSPSLSSFPEDFYGNYFALESSSHESKLYYHVDASGFVMYE